MRPRGKVRLVKDDATRRVDFLAWRPQSNATSRCRGAAYVAHLAQQRIRLRFRPPAPSRLYHALNDRRGALLPVAKLLYFLIVLLIRFWQVLGARSADAVIVQRELYPFGPPFFERLLARLNPRLVYDFDDAVDLPPPHLASPGYRFHDWSKFTKIAHLARHLLAASPRLAERAAATGTPTTVLPTPVDTDRIRPATRDEPRRPATLGWIGNGGNLYYLDGIARVLAEIQQRHGCPLVVISDRIFRGGDLLVDNVTWSLSGEAADLQRCDIGLMPLEDNAYARAKAGHKILTYWAAGLPVVASPVGINAELITHGTDGFLATTPQQWRAALEQLIEDAALRRRMGTQGRHKVDAHYSQRVCARRLAEVLEPLLQATR